MTDPLLDAVQAVTTVEGADACRVFHGRGHAYDGRNHVNVDLFPPVVLITLYQTESEATVRNWCAAAAAVKGVDAVLVQRRYERGAPTTAYRGNVDQPFVVTECGLRFQVRLGRNQNSGLFLDMAAGRQWVREHANQRRVLNLFAYTCTFSVAALAGGADEVVNLDMSSGALAQGRGNHQLNQQDLSRVRFLNHELFRSFGKLRKIGPFDLIIVDPPSYQPGSFSAVKDYPRLMARLPTLLAPGGDLLLCLNDPGKDTAFLRDAMAERAPELTFVERLVNTAAFVESDPERGLKVLRYCRSPVLRGGGTVRGAQ